MKTVFKGNEIAHVWANRGAPHGRAGNLSFDGDAFKSYNTVIARRLTVKGRTAYVVDTAGFSVSTRKHQSEVRGAIRDADKVFTVSIGSYNQRFDFTPATLRDYFLAQWKAAPSTSRYTFKRAEDFLLRRGQLAQALEVARFFKLGTAAITRMLEKTDEEAVQQSAIVDEHQRLRKERRAAVREKQQDEMDRLHAEENNQLLAEALEVVEGRATLESINSYTISRMVLVAENQNPELFAKFSAKVAEKNAADIAAWIDGDNSVYPGPEWPTLLRVEDPAAYNEAGSREMVTTKGARVPLADAHRAYLFAKARQAKGWHANGEQCALGYYKLDAVNENGVVAGCHRVTWMEIDRFAASQGWVSEVVS